MESTCDPASLITPAWDFWAKAVNQQPQRMPRFVWCGRRYNIHMASTSAYAHHLPATQNGGI